MNTIAKVLEFHEAFVCAIGERPGLPDGPISKYVTEGARALREALGLFKAAARHGDPLALRCALITEELAEMADAADLDDPEAAAAALDALVDLRYVLDGTVIAFGFHRRNLVSAEGTMTSAFEVAFDRVHAANMAKLHDGKVVHNEIGKVVKPPGWAAPDLSDLIV